MSPGYLVGGCWSSESYFSHTHSLRQLTSFIPVCHVIYFQRVRTPAWNTPVLRADRYHTSLPWVFFQPNTKLTKAVVKFRWCSPITLGKNLSLINEDAGKSYWNKKQNQTYWVRKHYFENQLKIQDVILIFTVKTNTKEPYHREKKTKKQKQPIHHLH